MRGCVARFNYAFDFEEMNKQIFFGQYKRISSYFDGTRIHGPTGLPEGRELEMLEAVCAARCRRRFSRSPTRNPVGGNPEAVRSNLREATAAVEGGRI